MGVAKAIFAKAGYRLVRHPASEDNLDAFAQQRRILSKIVAPVIFDVGAHHGAISKRYAGLFPAAKIWAFEPFPESFEALARNVAPLRPVTALPVGLAEVAGERELNANLFSPTNSILDTHRRADEAWGAGVVATRGKIMCRFSTIDAMLAEHRIERINLLKLDVQGAEYKVLQGAAAALAAGAIDVIYMEIILVPTYDGQWRLAEYLEFLEARDFALHGMYNLSHHAGRLRQIDAIFVRDGF